MCDRNGNEHLLMDSIVDYRSNDKAVKYVMRFLDKDTVKFEIWDLAIGENGMAVMTIDYKRRKADAVEDAPAKDGK